MRWLDNVLQRARLRRAAEHITRGATVLDIGCHRGELAELLAGKDVRYLGIDPEVVSPGEHLVQGRFPDDVPPSWGSVDHVVALAVLEHVEYDHLEPFLSVVHQMLQPGGSLIATVPSPATDKILDVLKTLRLVDGMDLHAHHGLTIGQLTDAARAVGLTLDRHDRFQLGLNNLFVWSRR